MSDFWIKCLSELKATTPFEIYKTWFSDLEANDDEIEDGVLLILAPSSAKAQAVEKSYGPKIRNIVNRLANRTIEIDWGALPSETDTEFNGSVSAENKTADKENSTPDISQTGLLPNLTFENMVEGNANQLAYAAALQVANNTSVTPIYNPLFIYGGVGLGKTHIMHAIGHRYLALHPQARVLCVSAQRYIQEFTDAARMNKSGDHPEAFRRFEARYQNLDLLLIDDIQSFATRTGTQTNFFLAFENMVPRGKQIVLTSDTYPRNLKDFQERLLSRLTQGLVVAVEPPELDMRIQILLQKAQKSGLDMPEDVAVIIAKRLKSNVRELEGAVQQVLAYTRFHNEPVTLDSVRIALRDVFKASAVPVTIEGIQKAVAEYYELKVQDMVSKSRVARLAKARQIAMYLARDLTQKSLPEIGQLFGGRDHATILHAVRKITAEKNTNEELKHDIHVLEQRIKN